MNSFNPYVLPLFVTAIISIALMLFVINRRKASGAFYLSLLMASLAIWALTYAFELYSFSKNMQIFWMKMEYFAIPLVSVFYFFFTLDYTRNEKYLSPKMQFILMLEPILAILFVWTNSYHGAVWREIVQIFDGPFPFLDKTYGWFFWIHTAYAYTLIAISTILIVHAFFTWPRMYRNQLGLIILGAIIPWISNFIYIHKKGSCS
jgi:hypothetical protein